MYDWGCSAVKETLRVRDRGFTKYHQPVWKGEDCWLVDLEHLAPEMLRAIEVESFEHLWGQKGGISQCDVW